MRESAIKSTIQFIALDSNYKTIGFLAILGVMILGFSCTQTESSSSILVRTQENIANHTLVNYKYELYIDAKYNDSEFRDTSYIELEKSDDNLHGLVFYISDVNSVDFFDGLNEIEIDHREQIKIKHNPEEIASDSTYFLSRMDLTAKPQHFLDIDSTYACKDSIIEDRSVVVFTSSGEEFHGSEKIKTVSSYVVDKTRYVPWIVKTITIVGKDTFHVITNYFHDIEFSNRSIDFAKVRSTIPEGYAETTTDQADEQMQRKEAQNGTKINIKNYENIFGEETTIFGRHGKKTVLMFSFIGCGGCEYALKEMEKRHFEFREDIDFYYSSPIDRSDVLKAYLPKKGFDGIGFGRESKMNENFHAYFFPTFFIIDSSGTITDVYHEYGNGFEEAIF